MTVYNFTRRQSRNLSKGFTNHLCSGTMVQVKCVVWRFMVQFYNPLQVVWDSLCVQFENTINWLLAPPHSFVFYVILCIFLLAAVFLIKVLPFLRESVLYIFYKALLCNCVCICVCVFFQRPEMNSLFHRRVRPVLLVDSAFLAINTSA